MDTTKHPKPVDHERIGGCYCHDPICYAVRTARTFNAASVHVEHDAYGRAVLIMPVRQSATIFMRRLPEHVTA